MRVCEAAVRSEYQGHQKFPNSELLGTLIILYADADNSVRNPFELLSHRKHIVNFREKYFMLAVPMYFLSHYHLLWLLVIDFKKI